MTSAQEIINADIKAVTDASQASTSSNWSPLYRALEILKKDLDAHKADLDLDSISKGMVIYNIYNAEARRYEIDMESSGRG